VDGPTLAALQEIVEGWLEQRLAEPSDEAAGYLMQAKEHARLLVAENDGATVESLKRRRR